MDSTTATPRLHIFVNRRRFEEGDGVKHEMTGAQIAALVGVPADTAVVREESPAKFTVLENVPTWGGAKTMALDPRTHRVYLVAADQSKSKKEVFLLIYEKQG